MTKEKNKWICETEETLVDTPIMELTCQHCKSSEDGRKHKFYCLKSNHWCNIIPVTETGHVVLVKQFRVGIGNFTLEIPGGVMDPADSDMKAGAVRELTEETGYTPLPNARYISLGWSFANPAIQNNRCHSFVIGPVRKSKKQNLDQGEMIETMEVRIEEIPDLIKNGQISHALILNAFFHLLIQSENGLKPLEEILKKFQNHL